MAALDSFTQRGIVRTTSQVSQGERVKIKGVRETVATFNRYGRFVRKGVEREIRRAEAEIRDLARSSVYVASGKLRRSIRVRRRAAAGDKDFGSSVISGGVKVSARHGVVEEAGKKGRTARPFFYRQLDVVGPKFDRRIRKLLAVDAIRKARPSV